MSKISKQIELDISVKPCKYNLLLNGNHVMSDNDKNKIWDKIDNSPFGTRYEVLDRNGNNVSEFIPF